MDKSKSLNEILLTQFYDAEISISELLSAERFQNRKLISCGGVKEVFSVTDTHCARDVAFATIKDEMFSIAEASDFIREIQITSGFEHPNIIRVYDVGIENDRPWFTMELSSNKTLRDFIDNNETLSRPERLEMFIQLCDAVHYAHERDVVHLDLKPDNVALGQQGQVMLADWGIASSLGNEPASDLTKAQSKHHYIKGSLGYMAPEQLSPHYKQSRTVDVFGLGCLLFFILTKESPILGDGEAELKENTRAGVIKSLKRSDIPERLAPMLAKALAKSPQERYQSVADLQSDVLAYRNGYATSLEAESAWRKFTLFCCRNKAIVAIVTLTSCILLASTAYYIISIKESERQASSARLLAEIERHKADEQAEQARSALLRYEKETILREQRDNELAGLLYNVTLKEINAFDFDQALSYSQKAVRNQPDGEHLYRRLATVHFIRQEFRQAHYYFSKAQKDNTKNQRVAIRAADLFKNNEPPLSVKHFHKLLHEIKDRDFYMAYLLKHDVTLRDMEEHAQVVALVLNVAKGLPLTSFKYDLQSQTLDLSSAHKLKGLCISMKGYPPVNVASTLPIKKLILKDTPYNRAHGKRIFQPNERCRIIFK